MFTWFANWTLLDGFEWSFNKISLWMKFQTNEPNCSYSRMQQQEWWTSYLSITFSKLFKELTHEIGLIFFWSCCPFSNSSHSYLKNYKDSILFEQKKIWHYFNLINIWLIVVSVILSCRCHVWVLYFFHWTIGSTITKKE